MKILVLGSNGFIGSHLVNLLRLFGYEVWEADISIPLIDSKFFFELAYENTNFSMPFKNVRFNFCVNCSGAADVADSIERPFRDFTLNVINVSKILESIRIIQPHCGFINLSSAAVYGNPVYLPMDENHPIQPISPYGMHKYQSELLCKEYYEIFGIKTCSLRIFSAYGNGLKKQILWDIWRKLKDSKSIELFGTGNESRDFIHVDDLTNSIKSVIEYGNFDGSVYNLANGIEISIGQIAQLFEDLLGDIHIRFSGENRIGYPINWCGNVDRLKRLGYNQTVNIRSGIKSYIQWAQENG